MSKCFPNSFAIPAAISEAGRSCEALRMDISARCVGSGCGSREVCRLLRGSAGGLSRRCWRLRAAARRALSSFRWAALMNAEGGDRGYGVEVVGRE